jgi:hypothetical protein
MSIYNTWRIVCIAEMLLIVLSLTYLARQSWTVQSAGYRDSINQVGRATTGVDTERIPFSG